MKNNYPIRYALMPIEIYGNQGYEVLVYLVSKCFVTSETKRYLQNGEQSLEYMVVFPYKREENQNSFVRVEPRIHESSQCLNAVSVEKIFMSFQEAKQEAEKKNEDLLRGKNMFLSPYQKNQQEVIQAKMLSYYYKLEEKIEKNTTDLNVNSSAKPQEIFVLSGNQRQLFHISLYDFLQIFNHDDSLIYTISETDFKQLKEKISDQESFYQKLWERNPSLLLMHSGEKQTSKIIGEESKGSFYLKEGNLFYEEEDLVSFEEIERNISKFKVYTMETYSELLEAYLPYVIEKETIPENKKLAKRLKVIGE